MRVRERPERRRTVPMTFLNSRNEEARVEIPALAVFGDFAATERLIGKDPDCVEIERERDERETRNARFKSADGKLVPDGYVRKPTYAVTHVPTGLRAVDRIRTKKAAIEAAEACSRTRFDHRAKGDPNRQAEWNDMVAAVVEVKRGMQRRGELF